MMNNEVYAFMLFPETATSCKPQAASGKPRATSFLYASSNLCAFAPLREKHLCAFALFPETATSCKPQAASGKPRATSSAYFACFAQTLRPFPIEHRDKLRENLLNTEKKNMKNSVALCGTSVNSVVEEIFTTESTKKALRNTEGTATSCKWKAARDEPQATSYELRAFCTLRAIFAPFASLREKHLCAFALFPETATSCKPQAASGKPRATSSAHFTCFAQTLRPLRENLLNTEKRLCVEEKLKTKNIRNLLLAACSL
jgi:hypothetical protein